MPSTGRRKQLCGRFPTLLYRQRPPQVDGRRNRAAVEGAEDHVVTAPAPQQIEHRKPVGVADDLPHCRSDRTTPAAYGSPPRLAGRSARQRSATRCGCRAARCRGRARPMIAVAIVLDLMNPAWARPAAVWHAGAGMAHRLNQRCNSRDAVTMDQAKIRSACKSAEVRGLHQFSRARLASGSFALVSGGTEG